MWRREHQGTRLQPYLLIKSIAGMRERERERERMNNCDHDPGTNIKPSLPPPPPPPPLTLTLPSVSLAKENKHHLTQGSLLYLAC